MPSTTFDLRLNACMVPAVGRGLATRNRKPVGQRQDAARQEGAAQTSHDWLQGLG